LAKHAWHAPARFANEGKREPRTTGSPPSTDVSSVSGFLYSNTVNTRPCAGFFSARRRARIDRLRRQAVARHA